MQIINKINPLLLEAEEKAEEKAKEKSESNKLAEKIALIKRFYDAIPDDNPIKSIVLGFMYLKLNVDHIKAAYLSYRANPGRPDEQRNIVALGSGKGMPLHLEKYPTLVECEKALYGIIERVEESIRWGIETNHLPDLIGSLTTGCCMESHSRTLLDYVLKEQGKRPLTLKEKMIAITCDLDKTNQSRESKEAELKTEDVFVFYAKHVGAPLKSLDENAQAAELQFLSLDQIADQLKLMGLYDDKIIEAARIKFQSVFSDLYQFRVQFLSSSEIVAGHIESILKWIAESKLTPEKLEQFSLHLTPSEVDLSLLIFTSVNRLDLSQALIKSHSSVLGNHRNSNTGKTTLIILINRILLINNTANKSNDEKRIEIAAIITLIDQLLAKGVDLYVRDEEGLSAISYALDVDVVIPDLMLGQRLLVTVKQPQDILGYVMIEMATKLPAYLVPLQNLLRSNAVIAFRHINGFSAFFYILGSAPDLVNEYFHKMQSWIVKADGLINAVRKNNMDLARLLYNEFNGTEEMEWKEQVDTRIKDFHYSELAGSLYILSAIQNNSSPLQIKLLREAIQIYERIVKKTEKDQDIADIYYRNLSLRVSHAAMEEKNTANQVAQYNEAIALIMRVVKKIHGDQLLLDLYHRNLSVAMWELASELKNLKEKILLMLGAITIRERVVGKSEEDQLTLDQFRRFLPEKMYTLAQEEKDPKKRVAIARELVLILRQVPIRYEHELQIYVFHLHYYASELAQYALQTEDRELLEEVLSFVNFERKYSLEKFDLLLLPVYQFLHKNKISFGRLFELAQRIAAAIFLEEDEKTRAGKDILKLFKIDLITQKKLAVKNDLTAILYLIKHYTQPKSYLFFGEVAHREKTLLFLRAKIVLLTSNMDEITKSSALPRATIEHIRAGALSYFNFINGSPHCIQWYQSVFKNAEGKVIKHPEKFLFAHLKGVPRQMQLEADLVEGMQKGLGLSFTQIETMKGHVRPKFKKLQSQGGVSQQRQVGRPRL